MQTRSFIGMDVHKATIFISIAEDGRDGPVRFLGVIPNAQDEMAKMAKRLSKHGELEFCYEAGGCGYGIHRQLTALGHNCTVAATSKIPRRPGEAREIFRRHTDHFEPLSLDEAYLDVTENKTGLLTATRVAQTIRQQIREELHLTASAGVAPNRFLAKIASDWRKPDGLFVIQPKDVESFLVPLPVGRIPGVGKVTEARLKRIGVSTVGDLATHTVEELQAQFGRYGSRLYELALGIDHSPVVSDRPVKSISAEDTFPDDIPLAATEDIIKQGTNSCHSVARVEDSVRTCHVCYASTKVLRNRVIAAA